MQPRHRSLRLIVGYGWCFLLGFARWPRKGLLGRFCCFRYAHMTGLTRHQTCDWKICAVCREWKSSKPELVRQLKVRGTTTRERGASLGPAAIASCSVVKEKSRGSGSSAERTRSLEGPGECSCSTRGWISVNGTRGTGSSWEREDMVVTLQSR